MKKIVLVAIVVMFCMDVSKADFVLSGSEQLTVNSFHDQGELHDTSRVLINSGGNVSDLNSWGFSTVNIANGGGVGYLDSHDSSTVNMSGGGELYYQWKASDFSIVNISGGSVGSYNAYGHSTINMFDGHVDYSLRGYGSSTINISDGFVDTPSPKDYSTMNMSGGSAYWFSAEGFSTTNISGGSIDEFYAVHSPTVDISGGSINNGFHVRDTATVKLHARNFQFGDGLTIDGSRILGTGMLSGEWADGTPWNISIDENDSTATILIVPEPTTFLLLGLGGLILRKR